jgi:hypothetical protein
MRCIGPDRPTPCFKQAHACLTGSWIGSVRQGERWRCCWRWRRWGLSTNIINWAALRELSSLQQYTGKGYRWVPPAHRAALQRGLQ